ncbi:MAG: type II secretion system protein GspG [Kiritimatiellaeota bacterium]|nr:type II secretion system protein GspG [Kiritimatiellota bacterium]
MKGKERKDNQRRNRRKGFTLVEMLVVITILGLLVGLGIKGVMDHIQTARVAATRANIKIISDAIQIFGMKHNSKLPDTLEELTVDKEDEEGLVSPAALIDAWGTPFNYSKQGKKFTITSAGRDGEFGTADDLTN